MLMFMSLISFLTVCLLVKSSTANSSKLATATTAGVFSAFALASPGLASEVFASQSTEQAMEYYQALSPDQQGMYSHLLLATGKKVSGSVKTQDVTLYRWQKDADIALGGVHVSFLLNKQGELAGFARMIPEAADSPLPSKEDTEQIARDFLQTYAPDLLPVMNIQWINPHTDEKYTDGEKQYQINGMKMKCRNKVDGTYFWVIIGSDRSVIVFERDIEWDFIRAGRQTEKWLHDDWLQKKSISFTKNIN